MPRSGGAAGDVTDGTAGAALAHRGQRAGADQPRQIGCNRKAIKNEPAADAAGCGYVPGFLLKAAQRRTSSLRNAQ